MLTEALGQLAAGLSVAAGLFAAMVLHSRLRAVPDGVTISATRMAQRLNGTAWSLVAAATLIYRPMHAALLRGHAAPEYAARLADLLAVSLAVTAFTILLAARGLARGLTIERVRRGVLVNVTIVLVTTGAAWLTR